jgi:hypothetical protein
VCLRQGKTLIILISLLCAAPVFAQSSQAENERDQFVQRLTWDNDPNVFKYEVLIERESGGIIERRITTDNYIEVSLPPGRYTYTVNVYNLLDIIEYRMSAVSFEVQEALQPVVTKWTPSVFNLADGNSEVTFSGTNLLNGAQILLVKNGPKGERVVTAEVFASSDGTSARVRLPLAEIEKGKWTVYITNPGGLKAVIPGFTVKSGGQINIDVSARYRPVMPVRSKDEHLFGLDFLGANSFLFDMILVNPFYQGAGLKLAWLPIRTDRLNFGFALEPYWTDLATEINYAYISPYMVGASASFLLESLSLNNHLALRFSIGGGILTLRDFYIISYETGNNTGVDILIVPFLDTGLSIKISPFKSFFVEFGISWNITPPFDNPQLQYLSPQAGIGYSF